MAMLGEHGPQAYPSKIDAGQRSNEDDCGDSPDRLVGRTEAARIIGVSESTLRRLEATALRPIVANGVHRHSVQRLLEHKAERARAGAERGSGDGELAAAAFEYFDRGLGPSDVVKLLKVTPGVASRLWREWAELGGGFVVGGTAATKIEQLALNNDGAAIRNGDDLLRLLAGLEDAHCSACTRRTRRFCLSCYVNRPHVAEQLAKKMVADSDARQQARQARTVERDTAERARTRTRGDGRG